jgi:ornithine--oxo-acid transaminase
MLEKMQAGIFAQLVVVPLFTDHRILSQVAGHKVNVVKGLPPLTISEEDVDWFATALDRVVDQAQHMGKSMTSFALRAARAGRRKPAAARA